MILISSLNDAEMTDLRERLYQQTRRTRRMLLEDSKRRIYKLEDASPARMRLERNIMSQHYIKGIVGIGMVICDKYALEI